LTYIQAEYEEIYREYKANNWIKINATR